MEDLKTFASKMMWSRVQGVPVKLDYTQKKIVAREFLRTKTQTQKTKGRDFFDKIVEETRECSQ